MYLSRILLVCILITKIAVYIEHLMSLYNLWTLFNVHFVATYFGHYWKGPYTGKGHFRNKI